MSSLNNPAHLAATGSALGAFNTFGQAAASATSRFAIDFAVDSPHFSASTFSFDGLFNISDFPREPFGGFHEATWAASLSRDRVFWFNDGAATEAHLSRGGTPELSSGRGNVSERPLRPSGFRRRRRGVLVRDGPYTGAISNARTRLTPAPRYRRGRSCPAETNITGSQCHP